MEDIGQEYAELADSVMINGAPPGTSHFQILQDRYIFCKKKCETFFTQILICRWKRYVVMTITLIILEFLEEILYSLCNLYLC